MFQHGMLFKHSFIYFHLFVSLCPQNDQSTEDLHILGAEDLSFLAGKVIFLLSTLFKNTLAFNQEQNSNLVEHHYEF